MADVSPEGKLLNIIKQTHNKLRFKKDLKLFAKINIILGILLVIIFAIFLVDIFTFNYDLPELEVDSLLQKEDILPVSGGLDEDVDKYIETVVKKEISFSKEDVIKNLGLLGIVTGDEDQAIIEDKETKKTFFLYKGDSFGEFRVLDIGSKGVILDYKGEKIELNI